MMYRNEILEIPEVWTHLVETLIDFVLDNGGTVDQVKEKLGGLRFYYTLPEEFDQDEFDAFELRVREAERASLDICEITGEKGHLHVSKNGYHIRTLSIDQGQKLGYSLVNSLRGGRED